jgi:hypothetical protein
VRGQAGPQRPVHGGLDSERLPAAEQAAQEHPRVKEFYAAYRGKDAQEIGEDTFSYGLTCVLDGLEARLEKS